MLPAREIIRTACGDITLLVRGREEVCLRFSELVHLITCPAQGFDLRPLTIKDLFDSDASVCACKRLIHSLPRFR
jgi:hypothetical protein